MSKRRARDKSEQAEVPVPTPTMPRRGAKMAAVVVALLLVAYTSLAWLAAESKSPTYDEPLHALSAWLQIHESDFRVDSEDPALWKYWAGLGVPRSAIWTDLKLPPGTPVPETHSFGKPVELDSSRPHTPALRYRLVAEDVSHEWPLVVELLYPCGRGLPAESGQCPDTDAMIGRMRLKMLVLAIGLGVVVAAWGWQLGGRIAAITAAALFCLDPNFLAHGPLVKNDVPLSLIGAGLFLAVWRAGRRLTIWNTAAIALLCAAGVTTKFSALLFGPTVAILLVIRAASSRPWLAWRKTLETRRDRLVGAGTVCLVAMLVSYIGIWAAYGFRFGPASDPSIKLNFDRMKFYTALNELKVRHGRMPTTGEMQNWQPSGLPMTLIAFEQARVLPQAWLHGLLYTYQSALIRPSYLLGRYSETGWWYYFPVAMLTKTPLATLLAAAGAIVVLVTAARSSSARAILTNWTALCLIIPPAIFLFAAMRSNLNLGLRHVLPAYPFIYLGIALAAATALDRWRVKSKWLAAALAIILATETLAAFPNFIPFFHAAAGGSRGGFKLLGDSNLDWGQDLKLLAQWQQDRQATRPGEPLYLVYFGLADPWAYGIRYVNFPGGYKFGPRVEVPSGRSGVLAISATALQGIYVSDFDQFYGPLRETAPLEVLGGSIYLYAWPPPAASAQKEGPGD